MGKTLSEKPYYKWLLLTIKMVSTLIMLALWLAPSSLMPVIMEDLSIDLSQAGFILTIITVVGGIMCFVGSAIVDKLGVKRTTDLALWMMGLSGAMAFFAKNYTTLIIVRFVFAVGYGLSIPANGGMIAQWFDEKKRGLVFTLNGLVSSIAMTLGVGAVVPLYNITGSWQSTLGVIAIVMIVMAVLWSVLAVDKKDASHVETAQESRKQQSAVVRALHNRVILGLTVVFSGEVVAYNAFTTYFPTFFQTFRGMSAETAGLTSSLLPMIGMVGSISAGFVASKFAKKQTLVFLFANLVVLLAGAAATIIPGGFGLVLAMCVIGLFNMLIGTLLNILAMAESPDPSFAGGAMALVSGFPQILTLAVPMTFGALSGTMGMQATFLIFCATAVVCLAAGAILMVSKKKTTK